MITGRPYKATAFGKTHKGELMEQTQTLFAGIVQGKFEIHSVLGKNTFELNDVAGLARFINLFKKHTTLATSSSIDFPEEDGAPKGFDARAILSQALHLAHA